MVEAVIRNASLQAAEARMHAGPMAGDDGPSNRRARREAARRTKRWLGRGGVVAGGAASLAVGALLGGMLDGIPIAFPSPAAVSPTSAPVSTMPSIASLALAADRWTGFRLPVAGVPAAVRHLATSSAASGSPATPTGSGSAGKVPASTSVLVPVSVPVNLPTVSTGVPASGGTTGEVARAGQGSSAPTAPTGTGHSGVTCTIAGLDCSIPLPALPQVPALPSLPPVTVSIPAPSLPLPGGTSSSSSSSSPPLVSISTGGSSSSATGSGGSSGTGSSGTGSSGGIGVTVNVPSGVPVLGGQSIHLGVPQL
ncbi:MAG: hypothetical protein ACYCTL_05495 [Acidimicrobiales bacterium]